MFQPDFRMLREGWKKVASNYKQYFESQLDNQCFITKSWILKEQGRSKVVYLINKWIIKIFKYVALWKLLNQWS